MWTGVGEGRWYPWCLLLSRPPAATLVYFTCFDFGVFGMCRRWNPLQTRQRLGIGTSVDAAKAYHRESGDSDDCVPEIRLCVCANNENRSRVFPQPTRFLYGHGPATTPYSSSPATPASFKHSNKFPAAIHLNQISSRLAVITGTAHDKFLFLNLYDVGQVDFKGYNPSISYISS